MKPYQPQAGTIPARVHAWMLTLPLGEEKTSAEIAEVLGQQRASIVKDMEYATERGLFVVRKVGKFLYWSLPTPDPVKEPQPAYEGVTTPSRVFVNASQREPLKTSWGQIRAGAEIPFELPSGGMA